MLFRSKVADVATYELQLNLESGAGRPSVIHASRKLAFGLNGSIQLYPAEAYKGLKGAFDAFQQRDEYTLTLKAAAR